MIADNPESLAYYWIILNGLYLHRWLTVLGKFRELTYRYGYNAVSYTHLIFLNDSFPKINSLIAAPFG